MAATTSTNSTTAIPLPAASFSSMKAKLYRLKITLCNIWRKVVVPENFSLVELHVVIQLLFGWQNYHLHHFMTMSPKGKLHTRIPMESQVEYKLLEKGEDAWGFMQTKDERLYKLSDIFSDDNRFLEYEYDFGECWQHVIKFEGIVEEKKGADYPQCVGGRGANKAEDSQDLDSDGELLPEYQNKQFNKEETQQALRQHFEGRWPLKVDKTAVAKCSPCAFFNWSFGWCPGNTCNGKCCKVCIKAEDLISSDEPPAKKIEWTESGNMLYRTGIFF